MANKDDKAPQGETKPQDQAGQEAAPKRKVGPQRDLAAAVREGEQPPAPAAGSPFGQKSGDSDDVQKLLAMASLVVEWAQGARDGSLAEGAKRVAILRYRLERAFSIASQDLVPKTRGRDKVTVEGGQRMQRGERVMTVEPGRHSIPGRKYQPTGKQRPKAGALGSRRG